MKAYSHTNATIRTSHGLLSGRPSPHRSHAVSRLLLLVSVLMFAGQSVLLAAEKVTYDFSGTNNGGVASHQITVTAPANLKPVVWGYTSALDIQVEGIVTLTDGRVLDFDQSDAQYITLDFSGPNFGDPGTWNDFNLYVVDINAASGHTAKADGWSGFSMVLFESSWAYIGHMDFAREPKVVVDDFEATIVSVPSPTRSAAISGVEVAFGAPVAELDASAFTTEGITVTNIAGAEQTYTIDLLLDESVVTHTIQLAAGAVAGANGGKNLESNVVSVALDATEPYSEVEADFETAIGRSITGIHAAADDESGSGLASVALWAKVPGGEWSEVAAIEGDSWSYEPADGSGRYEFTSVASDNAGNAQTAPSGDDFGQTAVFWNSEENGEMGVWICPTRPSALFPMTDEITITLEFEGVASAGLVKVVRRVGENAPPNVSTSRVVHQSVSINLDDPELLFELASVTMPYDPDQLGNLYEDEINHGYRFDGTDVSDINPLLVDSENKVITFETTQFSDFYFGNNDASVSDWLLMN